MNEACALTLWTALNLVKPAGASKVCRKECVLKVKNPTN